MSASGGSRCPLSGTRFRQNPCHMKSEHDSRTPSLLRHNRACCAHLDISNPTAPPNKVPPSPIKHAEMKRLPERKPRSSLKHENEDMRRQADRVQSASVEKFLMLSPIQENGVAGLIVGWTTSRRNPTEVLVLAPKQGMSITKCCHWTY